MRFVRHDVDIPAVHEAHLADNHPEMPASAGMTSWGTR
jgi:hypothetical protein